MIFNQMRVIIFSCIIFFPLNFNLFAQLRDSTNQADYIIITPSQFVNTLRPFTEWRQKRFNVKVAELQQIYDEFPDSTKPYSIRDFVSYALTYWNNPKPQYVLLVGGGKLLPSYVVPSDFSRATAYNEDSVSIDEWYSVNLYEPDTKPDVDIGRLPVYNEQELNNIILKTIRFEDSLSIENYPIDFLFLTDKTDSVLFEENANEFINTNLPLSFSKETIFAGEDSSIQITREHLFNALAKGTLFFSYYGHGAPDKWSRYKIFAYGDQDSLSPNGLPFILTSAACEQPFDPPNDSSIVRSLLLSSDNGTVASVNSTGLNLLWEGADFLTKLYNNIFSSPDHIIGNAVLQTKLNLEYDNSPQSSIARRYTLLGDPALKIPLGIIAHVADKPGNNPGSYSLAQNFPNPFNPTTTIRFSIPEESFVIIKVYDITGKEISTLVNERKTAGNYSVVFNASGLPSGVYLYRMQTGIYMSTKKFILLK